MRTSLWGRTGLHRTGQEHKQQSRKRPGRWAARGAAAATLALGCVGLLGSAGHAQAAAIGKVDPGVALSSVVYGTGCTYSMTVQVNSSGLVRFYETRPGGQDRFIGQGQAYGALATARWTPNRIGDWHLYAVQDGGQRSELAPVRVRQGHGSGGWCIAF